MPGIIGRLPIFTGALVETLSQHDMGVYWLFVALVAIPLGWRARGELRVAAVWLVLFLGATGFVFLVTPDHVAWHVRSALPRVICQLSIPAAFLVVHALARLWTPSDGGHLAR